MFLTCPIHGDFEQNAQNHLKGHGCKECGHSNYVKSDEDCLYVWRLIIDKSPSDFYKIGITSSRLGENRINSVRKSASTNMKVEVDAEILIMKHTIHARKLESLILDMFDFWEEDFTFSGSEEICILNENNLIKLNKLIELF